MTPIKKALLFSICTAAIGVLVVLLAKNVTGFAQWYGEHIFPVFPNTVGRVLSILPFSVLEAALFALAIGMSIFIVRFTFLLVVPKWRHKAKKAAQSGICAALVIFGISTMMICLACTVNYERPAYAVLAGQQTAPSSPQALMELCNLLIEDLERLAGEIATDEAGIFTTAGLDVPQEARVSMKTLGQEKQFLSGYYPNPKPVAASKWMSKLNLTGIFSPITMEANYNRHVPEHIIPYTICHELAHLKGFIREDEAGFIAYMACIRSKTAEFQYSGTINALKYALNAIYYEVSSEEYAQLVGRIPEQVRRDLNANYEYWQGFRGKISTIAEKANDSYLKANAQEGGVKSYGRMIDLLIAEYHLGAEQI